VKITFIAFGTRGDVQPAIALGKALQADGHQVRLVAGSDFGGWIEQHGLQAAATSVDMGAMMASEDGRAWVDHGNHPVKQMRAMKTLLEQYGLEMMRDALDASLDAGVIVSGFTSDVYAASIAEAVHAKHLSIPLAPALVATRSGVATQQAPLPNRDSLLNYWFGKWLIEPLGWRLLGELSNRFRQETLGLPPRTYRQNREMLRGIAVVQGFSRHVVPHPADWPGNIYTTGYWFLDDQPEWEAPRDLLEFLAAGDAPVYIGFGSMAGSEPQALFRMILDGVIESGQRAILQGLGAEVGVPCLPANVFVLDAAPHRWLFPRMTALVHHGGAGTTGEGLRAGVPTVVVPHMADQPYWGSRVAALGAGPRPIPRNRLTAGKLASAIRQAASDPAMRDRAVQLGSRISAEDGLGVAVRVIDEHLKVSH
jgi:sterol 3beta-glucosyltransferase